MGYGEVNRLRRTFNFKFHLNLYSIRAVDPEPLPVSKMDTL